MTQLTIVPPHILHDESADIETKSDEKGCNGHQDGCDHFEAYDTRTPRWIHIVRDHARRRLRCVLGRHCQLTVDEAMDKERCKRVQVLIQGKNESAVTRDVLLVSS